MVKFRDLVKKERSADPRKLIQLFGSFDRQASHTELRPAQREALEALSERRNESQLILKISTGTGKTAVGLTYLQSHAEESGRPVAYLCPTVQLVSQVCDEASHLGISALEYPAGQSQPAVETLSGKAVLVCTYDKLFNALTTFDRQDVQLRPVAMVLDDAHAGVEEVRDAFTLRIRENEPFQRVFSFLRDPCSGYRPGLWSDIEDGDPRALLEVPYWLWRPLVQELRKALSRFREDREFCFVWPFIRDTLDKCRCVVSGSCIEIVPDVTPVSMVAGYRDCPHKLYMSATLADDSVLVRELDCSSKAAQSPIRPASDRGIGERMVLAPFLIDKDLDRAAIMAMCRRLTKIAKVVVLSPSEDLAREWEEVGASVFLGDDVAGAVQELRDKQSELRFAAFAQRYDGLDLPDDSCRILVIDGLPIGQGVTDRLDSMVSENAGGIRSRMVYRIEQGMGRAVRSHVDYAVVLLVGAELSTFVARRDVKDVMNPDTQAQLDLAQELVKLAREEGSAGIKVVQDMIRQCLGRDEGWKQFYDENVRQVLEVSSAGPNATRIDLAHAERAAAAAALAGDARNAAELLQAALNRHELQAREMGWYLQRLATFVHEVDEPRALEIQQSAHEKNSGMFRPPTVLRRPSAPPKSDPGGIFLRWFRQFENPNGAVAAIQDIKGRLNFEGTSDTVEQALADLSAVVGADGTRPEKDLGEGPDDLWLWPDVSLVIEAKTGNQKSLHRKDAGQLLQSLQWFTRAYSQRPPPVPIILARVTTPDRGAEFPSGTRVIVWESIERLLSDLEGLCVRIADELPIFRTAEAATKLLAGIHALGEGFVERFTVPLG